MLIYELSDTVIIFLVALIGLLFGSFATMAVHRIPLGQDIVFKRSHCTSCKTPLNFRDLFPFFSWVLSAGKCRYCGTIISARYPIIEIIVAATFVGVFLIKDLSPEFFILSALGLCLIIIIVIDLQHTIIPDVMQVPMFLLGVLYQFALDNISFQLIWGPLAGIAFGMALRQIFWWWKRQEALGMGDVKFLAVVGVFLEPELVVTFLFMSGVIGTVTGLLWQAAGKGRQFPFGPALALSLFFCLLFPESQQTVKEFILSILM